MLLKLKSHSAWSWRQTDSIKKLQRESRINLVKWKTKWSCYYGSNFVRCNRTSIWQEMYILWRLQYYEVTHSISKWIT